MKRPRAEKLKSGKYRARLQVDKQRFSAIGETKKEAQDKVMELCLGFQVQRKTPLTVGAAIDRYISEREKTLSPYTLKGYRTIRRNYFKDLMEVKLSDLAQSDIQKAVLSEEAAGKSAKTIKNAHGLLTAMLNEFRPEMVVKTKLPKRKTQRDFYLPSEEEMVRIWQAAKGDKYEIPVLLASWLGLRMSEVRGLKYGDISDGVLHVQRARIRVKGANIEKTPKTAAGDRYIRLPITVLCIISCEATDRFGELDDKHMKEYICPYSISAINDGFIRICKKAGVRPCRFHDLRHFAASEALALGVPDKYSMKRMGHATTNMLKTVYQHTMAQKEQDFSSVINEHLEKLYNGQSEA